MRIDLGVAERQALGYAYDPKAVEALLAGRVTLLPHSEWDLPDQVT